jgi:hypothetical protein
LRKSQKRRTVLEKQYHIVKKVRSEELGSHLARNGQELLPMVELIDQSRMAADELIDVLGRAQIEAVLRLSADRIAAPPHPRKKSESIGWHQRETGTVFLKERELRVKGPRLRKKAPGKEGEVLIPAYEAMRHGEGLVPINRMSTTNPASIISDCEENTSCLVT